MASADTLIKFVVPDLDGARRKVRDLFTETVSLGEAQGKSARETLSLYEKQIAALKERSKFAQQVRDAATHSSFQAGEITSEQKTHSLAFSANERRKDNLEASYLKNIAELLKEVVRTDNYSAESLKKMLDEMGEPKGDGKIGKFIRGLREDGEEEEEKKGGGRFREGAFSATRWAMGSLFPAVMSDTPMQGVAGAVGQVGSAMMSSGNPYMMIAGVITSAFSAVAKEIVKTNNEVHQTASPLVAMKGGTVREWAQNRADLTDAGISALDQTVWAARIAQGYGNNLRTNYFYRDDADRAALAEKGFGISAENLTSIARLGRANQGSFGPRLDNYYNFLAEAKTISVDNMSLANEGISAIAGMANSQYSQFGDADEGKTGGLYAMMGRLNSRYADNPQYATNILNQMTQGISNNSNAVADAYINSTIANMYGGNISYRQIQEIRANPAAHPDTYSELLRDSLKKSGGDRYLLSQQLGSVFDLDAYNAGKLADATLANPGEIDVRKVAKDAGVDWAGEAQKRSHEIAPQEGIWNAEKINAIITALSSITTAFGAMRTEVDSLTTSFRKWMAVGALSTAPNAGFGATRH